MDVEGFCKACEYFIASKVPQPRVVAAIGRLLAFRLLEVVAMEFAALEPSSGQHENVLFLKNVFFKVYCCTANPRPVGCNSCSNSGKVLDSAIWGPCKVAL